MGSGAIKWHVHCSVCGAFIEKSAQSDSEVECRKCRSTLEILVKDDMVSVRPLIARDIIVLTAGCSSGGIENCGLMTPEAAQFAGPKLRAVCEKLGIPPVLNFGPCLAIGRLEIVATELAETIGVDLPQLPLVLSAAQWLEEQALADGCFGLALGLPLHLGLPPFVTGSGAAVKILTEDMKELTGGQVIINPEIQDKSDRLLYRFCLQSYG